MKLDTLMWNSTLRTCMTFTLGNKLVHFFLNFMYTQYPSPLHFVCVVTSLGPQHWPPSSQSLIWAQTNTPSYPS